MSLLAATAPLLTTDPASAETFAQFGVTPVSVSATCLGTAGAEAMVAPLQAGDHLENGVRVVVRFSSDNHDNSGALTASATWHNLDTGASGGKEITVGSTASPASGARYGNAGYNRANFWTGPGTVVVAVSTYPHSVLRLIV